MRNTRLIGRLLDVIEDEIAPLTSIGVAQANKVFGAAVMRKSDLSTVVADTNNEIENPLWHGEVHTLKKFYEIPVDERPATSDCIFLSTHEPCSLCLSAITWAGFDNFYYLFRYDDTSAAFNIPHDLKILQEVFAIKDGNYVRENAFWKSYSIIDMISEQSAEPKETSLDRVEKLVELYAGLSDIYQRSKEGSDIPLG
jgi:tRNA(Arg) A34 adenosine deaminase TadA